MFKSILFLVTFISYLLPTHASNNEPAKKTEQKIHPQAVILQYHHVSETTPPSTSISPELFAQHLELIDELGFQVLPLKQVISTLQAGNGFKQKTLAITFDDAYNSIYFAGYPLLKQRQWPFTIFINPSAIDQKHGQTMTWEQLKEMQENGAMISNHSYEHLHLLEKSKNETLDAWKERITQDIQRAQQRLEEKLNIDNQYLAYPYGEFDESLKSLLKEMGYLGFSQQSGPIHVTSDFQSLPRFPAAGIYANTKTLKLKMNSLAFTIQKVTPTQTIRSTLDMAPALTLVVDEHDVRYQQAQCYYQGNPIPTQVKRENNLLTINAQYDGTLTLGRSRYNCTAPSKTENRYYWYSMPFVALDESQQWVD